MVVSCDGAVVMAVSVVLKALSFEGVVEMVVWFTGVVVIIL